MTDLLLIAVLLVAGGAAAWLVGDLRTVVGGAARPAVASLAVVVPARDEEAMLPALLESVRGPGVEVIVVDDDSRDATASVARAAGARVMAAGTPPPGWTGKAWACHVGAQATTSELLLFLDADTVLAPDALDGLRDLHSRHGGLVSVQPFHAVERPHEQLSAYFNVVAVLASGAFAPGVGRRPMAFGPCLLTSRADYERVGGHVAVRAAILDDVELAVAYDGAGLPVRCWVGGDRLWMRSYPDGLGQLVSGWTKNIASGASAAAPGPTLGTVLWISAHHAVAVGALLALVEAATGWGAALSYGHPLVWAVAWAATAWQLRSLFGRFGSFRWWTWSFFPVPLLAFDLVFARSAVQTTLRREVHWRGRAVDLRHRSVEEGA